jgi:hypothetical protein
VRIYRERGGDHWNTDPIVAIIELAPGTEKNPKLSKWMEEDYFQAIRELAEVGAGEILRASDPVEIQSILNILAIATGIRTHAKFLLSYTDEELLDIERRASRIDSQVMG